MYGQYNGYYKQDNNFSVSQTIPFPGAMISRSSLGSARVQAAGLKVATTRNELIMQVKTVYYTLLYLDAQHTNLVRYDSVFQNLTRTAHKRHEKGDGTLLEKMSAESRLMEIRNQILNNEAEQAMQQMELQILLNSNVVYGVDTSEAKERLLAFTADTSTLQNNPYLLYLKQQVTVVEKEKTAIVNTSLPDIKLGYFNQSLYGVPLDDGLSSFAGSSNRFQGISVGLAFPLWFVPDVARAKAYESQIRASQLFAQQQEQELVAGYKQAVQQYLKNQRSLAYYTNTALPNAKLIYRQSERAFEAGEISYAQHQINLQQSISIIENYTQTLLDYNKSIIQIEFYTAP
jgi:cobalt-zinc-cadmium resistance protein CzcA